MDNEKVKQELSENIEELIEIEEEPEKEEESQEYDDVDIDINYDINKLDELNEYEAMVLASKVEVELQKYEDMILKSQKEFLSEEELIGLWFNEEEYQRLRVLDSALYKHTKTIDKATETKSIFTFFPIWLALFGFIVLVFNFYPVNPLLFMHVIINLSDKYENIFANGTTTAYILYFVYVGVFYIPLLVGFIIYLIKGIKDKIARKSFYWYIVVLVIDIAILLPGLIKFLKLMAGY